MYNNNLKYCREKLEMTQAELGYIFGVTKQTISGWENAKDTIPFNKLVKFSNLYGYSLNYISGFSRKNIKYNDKAKLDKKEIGKKLKEIRSILNLSQQKLSDECGISQTTYSGYETGRYLINTTTIYTICEKYNVSMDWLVGRNNNKFLKVLK